ncbi:XUV1 [Auxenochlorella protothecoides x Auxenochlorella symbiontica]
MGRFMTAWREKRYNYILLGDYDYKYLCMPVWPFKAGKRDPPTFFATDAWLGILTAMVMGLQHAMAMVGGLITPPLLISAYAANDPTLSTTDVDTIAQYLVSAALLVTSIMTAIQVTGIPLPYGRQWGAGILSVMGISFTTYPIAVSTISALMADGHTFREAYGYLLGTLACVGITPVVISFFPPRVLKRIFPPIVCGVTIVLIGINLTGAGMANWGGGSFCNTYADGLWIPQAGPCTVTNATSGEVTTLSTCYTNVPIMCSGNGDVMLPFGSGPYVGLGFSVFVMLVIIELFGSPFLRNCAVIISLLFGYMLAGVTRADGKRFVTGTKIANAPAITFLWVHTFPLNVYGPAVLPLIIVFTITSIETVGDVAATEEASFLQTSGPAHNKRTRGALLNDGISGIFSALATSLPLTTFAQNNGIIALTAVASRQAGWACAGWLFIFGLIGKFGGVITTIPNCVLGGMTTFLFANVIASGIKIMISQHFTRRNRFVIACALALGIGVTLVPNWAQNNLWNNPNLSEGVQGVRDALILILETGFTLGALTAIVLNLLLPDEKGLTVPEPDTPDLSVQGAEPSVRYSSKPQGKDPLQSQDTSMHMTKDYSTDMQKNDSGSDTPGANNKAPLV